MTVYLVGAGPGDPDLLTLRGAEVLACADVVLYDRLVSPELVGLAPPDAIRIDVGKRPGQAGPQRQSEINQLLVQHGRNAQTVVRLKGGDPFVFGRGGEEAEALSAAGVSFEVVPGVSSAFAVPAAAGVPVTHRGLSRSVTVVTGHLGDEEPDGDDSVDRVDWDALAQAGGTVVIMMGMQNRSEIARRLISAGRAATTPVLVVQDGTTAHQKSVRCTLDALGDVELDAPSIIVVGEVAGLDLAAEPSGALSGKTVVVTRPLEQSEGLKAGLEKEGARVILLPVVAIADPSDGGSALRAAAERASQGLYSWIAFTSSNSVDRFLVHVTDAGVLRKTRIAGVGAATEDALAAHGLVADLVPEVSSAQGLADAMPQPQDSDPEGERPVLFPRSEIAGEEFAASLRDKGWKIEEVDVYRTVAADAASGLTEEAMDAAAVADVVTFASPSSVRCYLVATARRPVPAVVACIGPTTAETARGLGLEVDVVATDQSADGLVRALSEYVQGGHSA